MFENGLGQAFQGFAKFYCETTTKEFFLHGVTIWKRESYFTFTDLSERFHQYIDEVGDIW